MDDFLVDLLSLSGQIVDDGGDGVPSAPLPLIGVLLLKQNDEWAVQLGCHMNLETIALSSDDPIIKLPAVAKT